MPVMMKMSPESWERYEIRMMKSKGWTRRQFDEWREGVERRHLAHTLARNATRKAVKSGVIRKPDLCQGCGQRRPLEAHHRDYDKPLEVDWFCRDCHNRVTFAS